MSSEKSGSQPRDGRRSGSSSARSTRANSAASEDNSSTEQRSTGDRSSVSVKKSSSSGASSNASYNAGGDGSSRSLHYSGEYLRKLEKSKLSRKQPECMAKLRQENLLRESWRNDKEERERGERESVQLNLGMSRRSFVAGCQVANIQPTECAQKPMPKLLGLQAGGRDPAQGTNSPQNNGNGGNNSGKDSNGAAAAGNGRRIGSGRLDRTFKDQRSDRDRDYGYGTNERDRDQGRNNGRRGAFEFRRNDAGRGRRFEHNSREDEPEWFTEGPTSQAETIELGGFEDARPAPTSGGGSNNRSSNASRQTSRNGHELRQSSHSSRSRATPSPESEHPKKLWSEKELLRNIDSDKGAGDHDKRRSPVSPTHNHEDDHDSDKHQESFPSQGAHQGTPLNFDHFFISSAENHDGHLSEDLSNSTTMMGSRFMSKVFAKAPVQSLPPRVESPPVVSERSHEPSESRPVLELLQAAMPQDTMPHGGISQSGGPPPPPPFLRELRPMPHQPPQGGPDMDMPPSPLMNMMNNHHNHPHPPNSNGMPNIMGMNSGNAHHPTIEALLGGQPHHGPPMHPNHHMHHPHPHGMPPPMEHMNNNGRVPNNNKMANCDNPPPPVTSGKELLEMLLMGASAPGAPSPPPPPPHHAKTVEQIEAEIKMQSNRQQGMQQQPPQSMNHGPHGGNMPMDRPMPGGMSHPPPMDRPPMNGMVSMGDMGHHAPPMSMGHHFAHNPPMNMGVHHPPPHQSNHIASQDIMRMLTEGRSSSDSGHGRGSGPKPPAFKQDLKNVPTQVLLREKELVIQREPTNAGPRPIVKSNKSNTPPAPPMPTPQPNETGAEFLQMLLQQHQQQPQPQPPQQPPTSRHGGLQPFFGGNEQQNAGHANAAKILRGCNPPPPPMPQHHNQPPLSLEELFASASQSSPQQPQGPGPMPRPLTGMHGHRYGEIGHFCPPPPHSVEPPTRPQNNSNNNNVARQDDILKWFRPVNVHNGVATMPPSMPRNVIRVEDLERRNTPINLQAKTPAAI